MLLTVSSELAQADVLICRSFLELYPICFVPWWWQQPLLGQELWCPEESLTDEEVVSGSGLSNGSSRVWGP